MTEGIIAITAMLWALFSLLMASLTALMALCLFALLVSAAIADMGFAGRRQRTAIILIMLFLSPLALWVLAIATEFYPHACQ